MATTATDLTVSLGDDRPGTLAKALESLGNAQINLDGYAQIEGTLHVLAKDAAAARKAIEAGGFRVTGETPVLVVEVQDRPGVAAGIHRKIADAGLNVHFSYVAANTRLVIGADNVQKAAGLF